MKLLPLLCCIVKYPSHTLCNDSGIWQLLLNSFPVWLRNRLISGGLEPVLSNTEKLCIASYYIQFSMNIKMNHHKINTSLIARAFGTSGLIKLVLISQFFILIFAKAVYNTMRHITQFSLPGSSQKVAVVAGHNNLGRRCYHPHTHHHHLGCIHLVY